MKGFVTKFALTRGIIEVDLVRCGDVVKMGPTVLKEGDWAPTLPQAVEIADTMRRRKIETIEEKIKLLRSIDFMAVVVKK